MKPSARPGGNATAVLWGQRLVTSFRYREFRWYWASATLTHGTFFLQNMVLSWQALEVTDSVFWVGAVAFAYGLPLLVLSPLAGWLADRCERRWVVMLSLALAALASGGLAWVTGRGAVTSTHILISSFLIGSAFSLHAPARLALLPSLVPTEMILNVSSLTYSSIRFVGLLGPVLAGALLDWTGIFASLVVQTLLFALASLVYFRTGSFQHEPVSTTSRQRAGVWRELWAFLRGDKPLLALTLLSLVFVPVGMLYLKLLPVFVRDILREGPAMLGLLTGVSHLGSAISGLAVVGAGDSYRKGDAILTASTAFGLGLVVLAFMRHTALSLGLIFTVGLMSGVFLTLSNALLLAQPPDHLRGRMMSMWNMVWGVLPVTSLLAGAAAEQWGVPAIFAVTGLAVALTCILMYAQRSRLRAL